MRFEFIHRTPTPHEVYAVHDFRGMALIGVGNLLRMYDFGKKKLLAKCENRVGYIFIKILSFLIQKLLQICVNYKEGGKV